MIETADHNYKPNANVVNVNIHTAHLWIQALGQSWIVNKSRVELQQTPYTCTLYISLTKRNYCQVLRAKLDLLHIITNLIIIFFNKYYWNTVHFESLFQSESRIWAKMQSGFKTFTSSPSGFMTKSSNTKLIQVHQPQIPSPDFNIKLHSTVERKFIPKYGLKKSHLKNN